MLCASLSMLGDPGRTGSGVRFPVIGGGRAETSMTVVCVSVKVWVL